MQVVPQYIDVEDKIVGPLTWKSLGWFFLGGSFLVFAWVLLDKMLFFIVTIPIVLFTLALSFYKPHGVPMVEFVGYGFTYLFRPKVYTWKRDTEQTHRKNKKERVKINISSSKKQVTIDDITAIAQTLDSEGRERSERLQQLIKERAQNK